MDDDGYAGAATCHSCDRSKDGAQHSGRVRLVSGGRNTEFSAANKAIRPASSTTTVYQTAHATWWTIARTARSHLSGYSNGTETDPMTTAKMATPIEKRGGYGSSSTPASKLTPPPSGVAPGARSAVQQAPTPKT